ncbi:hypothetical protein BJX61DRAFT_545260 [Aspergillus egyptiacus]|nr:hypothetical protein BJX61DRAFT_545260 [Aspergillus egyptiacus]
MEMAALREGTKIPAAELLQQRHRVVALVQKSSILPFPQKVINRSCRVSSTGLAGSRFTHSTNPDSSKAYLVGFASMLGAFMGFLYNAGIAYGEASVND